MSDIGKSMGAWRDDRRRQQGDKILFRLNGYVGG